MTERAVHREVLVTADVETAFELFTAHIAAWWPLGSHGVFGAAASVAFEQDRLVERTGTQVSVWAEVLEWEAPHRVRLSWHPGEGADDATDLTIAFTAQGDQVLVSLHHTGWERLADPGRADSYEAGWQQVLDRYDDRVRAPRDGAKDRWYALEHRPGPAMDEGESPFDHPLFAEHAAFLDRLQEAGRLVAAGPLTANGSTGMTVIRLAADDDVDVETLATEDDRAVAGGCLTVTVRPWDVRLSG